MDRHTDRQAESMTTIICHAKKDFEEMDYGYY